MWRFFSSFCKHLFFVCIFFCKWPRWDDLRYLFQRLWVFRWKFVNIGVSVCGISMKKYNLWTLLHHDLRLLQFIVLQLPVVNLLRRRSYERRTFIVWVRAVDVERRGGDFTAPKEIFSWKPKALSLSHFFCIIIIIIFKLFFREDLYV